MNPTCQKLRLILGDQLNHHHSWFKNKENATLYVMMECLSETNYVRHHIQKVTGFFLAMRAFAQHLEEKGHEVLYLRLDDPNNQKTIATNISMLVEQYCPKQFEYQLPDEYRLDQALTKLTNELKIETKVVDTEHFLSPRTAVTDLFAGKKQFLMETFYRKIRKQYNLLMEKNETEPLTGRWNYDHENRKKLPKQIDLPEPLHLSRDVSDIVKMLNAKRVETIGAIQEKKFQWPVNRKECLAMLDHFLQNGLRNFGLYQDALTDRHYLLFHSKLSFGLNIKLLHPLEVGRCCMNRPKNILTRQV